MTDKTPPTLADALAEFEKTAGSPLAAAMARVASETPEEAAAALARADEEALSEAAAERAEYRRRRYEEARPKVYSFATFDSLTPQQDPEGRGRRWLASDHKNALLVGPSGHGKCLDAGSLVYDPDTGLPHRIEDLVQDRRVRSTWTMLPNGDIDTLAITDWINSGVQPTLRVTTATGRSVIVTPHHPLMLPDGWRRADAIAVGENIALPARLPGPRRPIALSDAEIDLLALLVAEGTCGTGNGVRFATGDPVMVKRAEGAAVNLGMSVKHLGRYDYALQGSITNPDVELGACGCGCGAPTAIATRTNARHGHVKGQAHRFIKGHGRRRSIAREFVTRHGIDSLAKDKKLPPAAYRLDERGLRRFLSVVWMADGWVDMSSGPGITLASKPLVQGIQHLLLRLGVQSSLTSQPKRLNGREFEAWRLVVLAEFRKRFAEVLDLWGEKGRRAREFGGRFVHAPRHGRIRSNRVLHASLREVARMAGYARRGFDLTHGGRAGSGVLHRENVALLAPHSDTAARLVSPELFWDRIVSIEPAGRRKVYDLTVAPTSCFIAEDVIVHNTFLAYTIANHAVREGLWVEAWSVLELLQALAPLPVHARSDESRSRRQENILDSARDCELLILDDLGAEAGSGYVADRNVEIITDILTARDKNPQCRTIVTLNGDRTDHLTDDPPGTPGAKTRAEQVREVKLAAANTIANRYGARVATRLQNDMVGIWVEGECFRRAAEWDPFS